MARYVRIGLVTAALGLATFFSGASLACNANYCEDIDTWNCVVMDTDVPDTCCKNLDETGYRCWSCLREVFYCTDGKMAVPVMGPAYNCHSPGPSCE